MRKSAEMEKKTTFSWSFKPLVLVAKIAAWIPLNFSTKNRSSLMRILVTIFLGSFSLLAHFIVNGPRSINVGNFLWTKKIQEYDSPEHFFEYYPDAKLQLAVDTIQIIFFLALLFIHFILIVTMIALTQKWKRLLRIVKKLRREMNLGEEFHRKCRRLCIIAVLFLLLVKIESQNSFATQVKYIFSYLFAFLELFGLKIQIFPSRLRICCR